MSEYDMTDRASTTSKDESGKSNGLLGILRSRYFAPGATVAVLLVGLLLARRLGIGGSLLPVVGLVAFIMIANSFLHRGHASRGRRGSPDSDQDGPHHFGCH